MSNTKKIVDAATTAQVGVKLNPFSLKRPPAVSRVFTFTDKNVDQPYEFTLKLLDVSEQVAAGEMAEQYCDRFLGRFDSDGQPTPPKQIFPVIDGQPVLLSKNLIQASTVLWMMCQNTHEVNGQEEKMYTIEDFIGMSVTAPEIWNNLGQAMFEMLQGAGDGLKN